MEKQSWAQRNWRSHTAYAYTITCVCDFIIFPVCAWVFAYYTKTTFVPWTPLTLQGAGLYHIAMGAIVGVTSWQKSNEQIEQIKKNLNGGPNGNESV